MFKRGKITEDICRRVITNIAVRVSNVTRQNSGHIEHAIHKGQIYGELFFVFIDILYYYMNIEAFIYTFNWISFTGPPYNNVVALRMITLIEKN